jgi:hypothetical protein
MGSFNTTENHLRIPPGPLECVLLPSTHTRCHLLGGTLREACAGTSDDAMLAGLLPTDDKKELHLRQQDEAVWVEAKNAGGRSYYWHRQTRKTVWEHPSITRQKGKAAAAAAQPPPAPPAAHAPNVPYHHPPSSAADEDAAGGEAKRQRLSGDAPNAMKPGQAQEAAVQKPVVPKTGVQRGGVLSDVLYNIDWRKPDPSATCGCLCGLECGSEEELNLHRPWCEAWEIDEFAPPRIPRAKPTQHPLEGQQQQDLQDWGSGQQKGGPIGRGRHLGKPIELVRTANGMETRLRFVTQSEAALFLGTSSAIISIRKRTNTPTMGEDGFVYTIEEVR